MTKRTEDIMRSIKQYSATRINKLLGRTGQFWQKENYDRQVRSRTHFLDCLDYMIANPRFLVPGTYELGGVALLERLKELNLSRK